MEDAIKKGRICLESLDLGVIGVIRNVCVCVCRPVTVGVFGANLKA